MVPTVHGFDEWMGNLYHLNAEEEPENVDYPKDPAFKAKFGPRGVLHCIASDVDDPAVDPRFGKMGKQKCEDTGALTKKRMETVDEEITAGAINFMDKAAKDKKPFFIWWNASRMHVFTHLKKESEGKTGQGIYADGMVEHDGHVGQLLAELKAQGLDQNTIVMYSSDNGAEVLSWPDGGTTMFRGEKNTPWEGGFRVPTLISWPGVIKPGTIINDLGAHEDMLPTLLAAAGNTTIKDDLLKGQKIGDMTYKVHLDGDNLMPFLKGDAKESPRQSFIYWTDDGNVAALRYRDYKVLFLKQNAVGLRAWQQPFEELRAPLLTNLRMDPFERAEAENTEGYQKWYIEHMFAFAPAAAYVGGWLQSFREFPPRMKPGSFSLDRVMESVSAPAKGSN
jgi:arylsulfatase A-like enzyme